MSDQPKKPQRNNKAKKLNLNKRKGWQDIVNAVDKREVPINVLQQIVVQMIDGTSVSIDIRQLLEQGQKPEEIEALLDEKFNELDQYIQNVDFFVDIDKVVDAVQPETDKVLKGL
jgi:uncharacterized membrane-anchored protein YjiN (DUF445 family)